MYQLPRRSRVVPLSN